MIDDERLIFRRVLRFTRHADSALLAAVAEFSGLHRMEAWLFRGDLPIG